MKSSVNLITLIGSKLHHRRLYEKTILNIIVKPFKYNRAGTADYIGVAVSTGSWVSCEYQGKTGITNNDHYLICGANSAEEDDDLVALADSAIVLTYGDRWGNVAGEYYLDNVKVDVCDKY